MLWRKLREENEIAE